MVMWIVVILLIPNIFLLAIHTRAVNNYDKEISHLENLCLKNSHNKKMSCSYMYDELPSGNLFCFIIVSCKGWCEPVGEYYYVRNGYWDFSSGVNGEGFLFVAGLLGSGIEREHRAIVYGFYGKWLCKQDPTSKLQNFFAIGFAVGMLEI